MTNQDTIEIRRSNKLRSLFWLVIAGAIAGLLAFNVVLHFKLDPWNRRVQWLSDKQKEYQKDVALLGAAKREYLLKSRKMNAIKSDLHKLLRSCRDAETFPIKRSKHIVTVFFDEYNRNGQVKGVAFVPSGNHTVRLAFQYLWFEASHKVQQHGYDLANSDPRAWNVASSVVIPPDRASDIMLQIKKTDADRKSLQRELVFKAGSKEVTFPLGEFTHNGGHYAHHFTMAYPNELVWNRNTPFTKTIDYQSLDAVPLTVDAPIAKIMNGSFYLTSPDESQKGLLAYQIWIESDGMLSVSAATATTYPYNSTLPDDPMLTGLFSPYDDSGRYFVRPELVK